jgi:hypothetical protein
MVNVDPLATVIPPVPVRVLPLQVPAPVRVRFPLPVKVPPDRVMEGEMTSLFNVKVPPLWVMDGTAAPNPAPPKTALPPLTLMDEGVMALTAAILVVPVLTLMLPVAL